MVDYPAVQTLLDYKNMANQSREESKNILMIQSKKYRKDSDKTVKADISTISLVGVNNYTVILRDKHEKRQEEFVLCWDKN